MKNRAVLAVILLIAAAIPTAYANGDAGAGKAVFNKRCASCHGPDGAGKDAIAKMYKVELRALGSKEVQAVSDADLKKVIAEGKGKMKPVKDLGDADTASVIAYVRSLAKK